jgi:hypothetical protein
MLRIYIRVNRNPASRACSGPGRTGPPDLRCLPNHIYIYIYTHIYIHTYIKRERVIVSETVTAANPFPGIRTHISYAVPISSCVLHTSPISNSVLLASQLYLVSTYFRTHLSWEIWICGGQTDTCKLYFCSTAQSAVPFTSMNYRNFMKRNLFTGIMHLHNFKIHLSVILTLSAALHTT